MVEEPTIESFPDPQSFAARYTALLAAARADPRVYDTCRVFGFRGERLVMRTSTRRVLAAADGTEIPLAGADDPPPADGRLV